MTAIITIIPGVWKFHLLHALAAIEQHMHSGVVCKQTNKREAATSDLSTAPKANIAVFQKSCKFLLVVGFQARALCTYKGCVLYA